MTSKTRKTSTSPDWYRRFLAWGMSKVSAADDRAIDLTHCSSHATLAELKQALFANLQGKILEIGPGAGANLAYYPADIDWIGIEPNRFMHPYLQREAHRLGLKQIDLRSGSAERLEVKDNSIDAVVSTHVLCSVANLSATLDEIFRVLKPGGRFLFLEHVAAECGTWRRRVQDGIEPMWKAAFDGCHPNRETGRSLENAGFESVNYQHFKLSIPIVSPHIVS